MVGSGVLALCLSLAGCSARGASLGTTSSPCFHALPAAAAAVHGQGAFLGVRLVVASRLRRRVPAAAALGNTKLCMVAYKGTYVPGDVSKPLVHHGGDFAVVGVNQAGTEVLGTLLLNHLPLAFRHNV
ncbi:MAG TPA: hypothetical protein VMU63_11215 [Acidimicrobiales bacterium]|nr:hypothetical protein [Acidimicrobiales bacterium]